MPRVSQEHKDQRRREITGAALRCVLREGFHKTTMADIISESGLSAGAVYGYFASKTDIIHALIEMSVGATLRDVGQQLEADPAAGPAELLDSILTNLMRLADLPDGDLTLVGVQAWGEALRDPEVKAIVAPRLDQVRAMWRQVAEREIALGHIPADADPDEVAKVLTSLLPGFILQRAVFGDVDREGYVGAVRALTAGMGRTRD